MRIVRVSRAFWPVIDGAALHVAGLSAAQAAEGAEVTVYQPHVRAWPDVPASVKLRQVPMGPLRSAIYRSKPAIGLFAFRAGRRIAASAATGVPDIVHVHGDALDAAGVRAGIGRTLARRVPIVHTVHGSLNTGARYRQWAPRLFRGVTRFIAVSQHAADQLAGLGIDVRRITVISSGIDFGRFAHANPADRRTGEPLRVISVGRLHAVKGYRYAIEAVTRLRARGTDVELTLVGIGPERAALEGQAGAGVMILGERTGADLVALLAASHVFVMPSIDIGVQAEGTPTAVLEAMAAGLPIVASETGGLPALLHAAGGGRLVPPANADALAQVLEDLGDAADVRREMGARNRAFARGKDWPNIARAVGAVYQEAADAVRGQ